MTNRHPDCPMIYDPFVEEYLCGNVCCIDCALSPCESRCEEDLIKKCNR